MTLAELRASYGWRLTLLVRPPADRRRDRHGRCCVCGWTGRLVTNSWILPADMKEELGDPARIDAFVARESSFCRRCGSSLRVRRITDVLLELYADRATTLEELVREPGFRRLRVAEVNSIQLIHSYLEPLPQLAYSEFRPRAPLGVQDVGARNEDLTRLTYGDAEFDLLLTSDTLEHVPDPIAALQETRRVLRPGGRHIFTVPLIPSRRETVVRATLDDAGGPVHREAPLYHGRGSGPFSFVGRKGDQLVFTDFGMDLVDSLRELGFEPEVRFLDPDEPDADAGLVFAATAVSGAD